MDDQIQERNLFYEKYSELFRSLSGLVVLQSEFNGNDVCRPDMPEDNVVVGMERLDIHSGDDEMSDDIPLPRLPIPVPGLFIESTLLPSLDAPVCLSSSAWPQFILDISRRLDFCDVVQSSWIVSELYFAGFGDSPDTLELFQTYMPVGYFADFVKGCVLLGMGAHYKALLLLRSASIGLSTSDTPIRCVDIAGRISPVFTEDSFGNGLRSYYSSCARYAARLNCHSTALALAKDASRFLRDNDIDAAVSLNVILLNAAVRARAFDDAYQAVIELDLANAPDAVLDRSIDRLVIRMCSAGQGLRLCKLPFIGLVPRVTSILERNANNSNTSPAAIDYHKILYSWYVERGNYSGGKYPAIFFFFQTVDEKDKKNKSNQQRPLLFTISYNFASWLLTSIGMNCIPSLFPSLSYT
jgi:hypothetical protein